MFRMGFQLLKHLTHIKGPSFMTFLLHVGTEARKCVEGGRDKS